MPEHPGPDSTLYVDGPQEFIRCCAMGNMKPGTPTSAFCEGGCHFRAYKGYGLGLWVQGLWVGGSKVRGLRLGFRL